VLSLVVEHGGGEISLEARAAETIAAVTRRAHEQLDLWQRFRGLAGEDSPELPPLGACALTAPDAAGRPARTLYGGRTVGECRLADGTRLRLEPLDTHDLHI